MIPGVDSLNFDFDFDFDLVLDFNVGDGVSYGKKQ